MIKITVCGCCHGQLDKLYKEIVKKDESDKSITNLVIICGDFQVIIYIIL